MKARLLDNAITEIAYLKRYNDDFRTVKYELVNIDNILKMSSPDNKAT